MKYWNKDKKKRRHWTNIETNIPICKIESVKRWCQSQSSNGKFYCKAINPFIETFDWCVVSSKFVPSPVTGQTWYFQYSEDAVLFSLRWS